MAIRQSLANPALCLALCSLLAPALCGGDPALNGRWNIEVPGRLPPAAWWLEVEGVDGPDPKGRFTGAPGGQTDVLTAVHGDGSQLRFRLEKPRRNAPPYRGTWTAQLVDGVLDGSYKTAGQPEVKWKGRRAPLIPDKDDGSWQESRSVALFDGRTVSGWRSIDPRKPLGWSVVDGIFTNNGKAANIMSERTFWNFILRVVFRVQKGSNSGIGLRGRYEVQIWDDFQRPIDGHSTGTIYGRILPTVNATKPWGEWQTYAIRLEGRQVTVVLNGVKVIDRKEIDGFTAIAIDPHEDMPGPLLIQGDHGMAEFREITLTPLTARK